MSLPITNGQLDSYAWPGGYPLFYLDGENSCLCPDCANKSYHDPEEIEKFKPIACSVNYDDNDLYCDQCSKPIDVAYT